jgi:hypothetical protein
MVSGKNTSLVCMRPRVPFPASRESTKSTYFYMVCNHKSLPRAGAGKYSGKISKASCTRENSVYKNRLMKEAFCVPSREIDKVHCWGEEQGNAAEYSLLFLSWEGKCNENVQCLFPIREALKASQSPIIAVIILCVQGEGQVWKDGLALRLLTKSCNVFLSFKCITCL